MATYIAKLESDSDLLCFCDTYVKQNPLYQPISLLE